MLIELITPLMLTTAPLRVDIPEGTYNHHTQVAEYVADDKVYSTYSGTQTFDANGKPKDSDND